MTNKATPLEEVNKFIEQTWSDVYASTPVAPAPAIPTTSTPVTLMLNANIIQPNTIDYEPSMQTYHSSTNALPTPTVIHPISCHISCRINHHIGWCG